MATKEERKAIPQQIENRLEQKMDQGWRKNQPIKILLDMVEEGEIDPWDLDIIKVADKFLTKVEKMERENLRVSGNTLLFSSILLRKKSEKLVDDNQEEQQEVMYDDPDWTPCFYDLEYQELPELEVPARRESSRSATLIDLIDEFENAMETKQKRSVRRQQKTQEKKETQEKVKNLAHEEDIEKDIDKVHSQLKEKFREKENQKVFFRELLSKETKQEIIAKYIPILFLAARKKIWIKQDNINSEIQIKPRNNSEKQNKNPNEDSNSD
ncbi:ScpA family protein [Methanonatronarchaeum sp. AMET6-2]|uniref:segregation and condensation protein A n=1 Tax=Methanonatronarchaeum sp. AMET6-2 TaxID=2933293 RepID=UPI00120E7930|nr:ScpA family protein [Methanonatronarchaeum sp. AMET6-2]RZN60182.1 MAG: segregation/condensation protein A [Methanonatronarchaeia archaeon]UOY09470.1 segregation/condensation protein A [Methanonatronarchaeum sp. AMET6-2]